MKNGNDDWVWVGVAAFAIILAFIIFLMTGCSTEAPASEAAYQCSWQRTDNNMNIGKCVMDKKTTCYLFKSSISCVTD